MTIIKHHKLEEKRGEERGWNSNQAAHGSIFIMEKYFQRGFGQQPVVKHIHVFTAKLSTPSVNLHISSGQVLPGKIKKILCLSELGFFFFFKS